MGPPWVTGTGLLAVLFIVAGFFMVYAWVLAAILLVIFVFGLITAGFGASADRGETPPDPVTGGPRWWQKRWDE
jgi:hypothetical protein